jgi:hypothetical protein
MLVASHQLIYWEYPMMTQFAPLPEWYIISNSVEQPEQEYRVFGANINLPDWNSYWTDEDHPSLTPTLRWIHEDDVVDLYLPDESGQWMSAESFLKHAGLELSLNKGGFVLSKRISRVFRRYLSGGFFRKSTINIEYMEQDDREAQIWDGGGVVSRKMLIRMIRKLPILTDKQKYRAKQYLKTAKRVEFTILTDKGQDKGHAMVTDEDVEWDFLLPQDTKDQIRFNNNSVFVGFDFPHGSDEHLLDMQSMMNLYPFYDEEYMTTCLKQEGQVFIQGVETNKAEIALKKIGHLNTLDDLGDWWLSEYFASGGHTMHYAGVVRAIVGQHLTRLRHKQLGRMRLPVNGGRYYVITEAIGKAAGMNINIPPGHCKIDADTGTLWVNDTDWGDFISGVTGGADHDDGYWIHQFRDTSDNLAPKILAWRSPNQMGEYIVLKPTDDCHTIMWDVSLDEQTCWREADSSLLPPRIDSLDIDTLDAVPEPSDDLGQLLGKYTVEKMNSTINRAMTNAGGLGWYCNILITAAGIWGKAPKKPPALLEHIIDANVKTGADLKAVKQWCKAAVATILNKKIPIPELLIPRVTKYPEKATRHAGHWSDTLLANVKAHIIHIEKERERIASNTQPPRKLIQLGKQYAHLGEGLISEYSRAWSQAKGIDFIEVGRIAQILELAQEYSLGYLEMTEDKKHALLGAIYCAYTKAKGAPRDTVVWQPEIAKLTLDALRSIEVLATITVKHNKLVVSSIPDLETVNRISVGNVWFNTARMTGLTKADLPSLMHKANKKAVTTQAKDKLRGWVNGGLLIGKTFNVQQIDDRQVLIGENGHVFGYVNKHQHLEVKSITVNNITERDGNVIILAS